MYFKSYKVLWTAFITLFTPYLFASTLETGTLPAQWASWEEDCENMPDHEIHPYNEDFYIIRQSGCLSFEKPFMYLIFGSEKAILFDTGAEADSSIAEDVFSIIKEWSEQQNKDVELIVTHTHSHPDHIAGDRQFKNIENVVFVRPSRSATKEFFGITEWPTQIVEYDLGDRVIDIIPIPGHDVNSIAVYDRKTGILLTGDSLLPGNVYVSYGLDLFTESTLRMVNFTKDKPVTHILGAHINSTVIPFTSYLIGTKHQPDEHQLQLGRAHLLEQLEALKSMEGKLKAIKLRDFTMCKIYPDC